jgi:tetratricopeptide (TPR) repeat protein
MPKANAKDIREDIARARSYAKKGDYLRTLFCMANAIKNLLMSPVFGAEKFQIYAHLDEALRDLNKMPMIAKLFPKGLSYQRGKEKAFYITLTRLHKKLGEAMEKSRVAKIRKRLCILDDNMIKAAKLVEANDPLNARKLYRKISEHFQDIDGIDSDIGNRMSQFGMFAEAIEYLTKALEVSKSDIRANNALITCYEGMNETDKALEAIKECMRWVGVSENLYLRVAKLQLKKREWGEVYNNAKAALDRNPLNTQAQKLMDQAEPRVFTESNNGGAKKAPPKKHDLNF